MPRKLPPRIDLPGNAPDFARPLSTLKELSEKLGISVYKLRKWKGYSKELEKGRPYSIGKCILQLLASGKISMEDLNEEMRLAMVFDVAIDAAEYQSASELLHAFLSDPETVDLVINEDDPAKLREKIKTLKPIKRNTWKPLDENESATIAVASPMTAALFFDRVWCMDDQVPSDIGLRFDTLEERICLGFVDSLVGTLADLTGANEKKLAEVREKINSLEFEVDISQSFESAILTPVKRMTGRDVSVFSASQAASKEVFGPGERKAAFAILDRVPLIEEGSLTWEQVSELRADTQSRRKLARFLHWVETDYANQPLSVIREGIEQKLADYEDAVKKHGIQRSLGRVSVLLDGSLWLAVALAFDHPLATVAGITVMGVNAAVTHRQCRISQKEVETQNPVAYIHEVISRTK
jgi:hypothetical protein